MVESSPNHAKGSNFEVNVTEAMSFQGGLQQNGFRVTFHYDFKDLKSVKIDGLGIVPSQGEFSYIIPGNTLTFRSLEGAVLASVAIRATVRPSEGGGVELPSEADFGAAGLTGSRTASTSFALSMAQAFNTVFSSGYRVFQTEDTLYCISSYSPLPNVPKELRAEFAVLVSHPVQEPSPPVPFRLQYIVRQKPKRSGDWDYKTTGLEGVVNPIIEKLMRQLNTQ